MSIFSAREEGGRGTAALERRDGVVGGRSLRWRPWKSSSHEMAQRAESVEHVAAAVDRRREQRRWRDTGGGGYCR
jgi:hypothetical protein